MEQVGQIAILGSWSTENNLILTPEEQTCQYVGWVSSALDLCLNGKLKYVAKIWSILLVQIFTNILSHEKIKITY